MGKSRMNVLVYMFYHIPHLIRSFYVFVRRLNRLLKIIITQKTKEIQIGFILCKDFKTKSSFILNSGTKYGNNKRKIETLVF